MKPKRASKQSIWSQITSVKKRCNAHSKCLLIEFLKLKRLVPNSQDSHKRWCPVCDEGLILMNRDPETGKLVKYDSCTVCGQRYEFVDILEVRRLLP